MYVGYQCSHMVKARRHGEGKSNVCFRAFFKAACILMIFHKSNDVFLGTSVIPILPVSLFLIAPGFAGTGRTPRAALLAISAPLPIPAPPSLLLFFIFLLACVQRHEFFCHQFGFSTLMSVFFSWRGVRPRVA